MVHRIAEKVGTRRVRLEYRLGGVARTQAFDFENDPFETAVEQALEHVERQVQRGFAVRDVRYIEIPEASA